MTLLPAMAVVSSPKMPEPLATEVPIERRARPPAASARIIAAGIVIGFCYFASSVVVTLLLAILLAYFLDPVVNWLEVFRLPRALGSLVALLAALGFALVDRVDEFGANWPQYRAPLRAVTDAVEKRLSLLETRVNEITPAATAKEPRVVTITEAHPVRDALLRSVGSLYTAVIAVTFVPFLVFFMLAAKRRIWHATMELFPSQARTRVKIALAEVSSTLRSYVVGTALVGLILVLASWAFFWAIGLDFPFLTALASGLINLVPYIGMVIAWVPPVVIGLKHFHTIGPFLGICGMLSFFHLMAANFLLPALVGRRVHLNAVAVTVALLFWGWLWGAAGLLLAIPITGTIKVVCDHVEGWQPVGRWLGA
ncbi:MAG TPA: AI-2E family transporter [Candidatus Acidoferrales bacterium]|nr:AI-2E family transporter [Candidatus Acidoferrales bacterium]